MVTMKEIAKRCNVSVATVSNILNDKPKVGEKTRKKVLEAMEEMNYTPNNIAKNLKMKTTRTIGVLIEDVTSICAPEIIDGITSYCEQKKYQVLLMNLRLYKKYGESYFENEDFFGVVKQEIRELLSRQVDGIIYVAAHERIIKCLPDDLKIPGVMAYGYTSSRKFPSVVVNDAKGAYAVTDYMIRQGHTAIGVIAGKEQSIHTRDRLLGYQQALKDHNITYRPDYVVMGGWHRENGYYLVPQILARQVTAIFCMNDKIAGGVYEWLGEHGMAAGRDVSIVGYDNQEVCEYMNPALTTVALPLFQIGERACRMLIGMIEGEEKDRGANWGEEIIIKEEGQIQIRCSVKTVTSYTR